MRTPASPKHHQEHKTWLSNIAFYQDQIRVFKKELSLVQRSAANQYSNLEHVEEYQGILQKKLNHLAELREKIDLHERVIASEVDEWTVDPIEHANIKSEMMDFDKSFLELKETLRRFVAKHQ